MSIKRQIQTQKQIDMYIKGKLAEEEIDKLWVKFLKAPELYDYFETELHLLLHPANSKALSEFVSINISTNHGE